MAHPAPVVFHQEPWPWIQTTTIEIYRFMTQVKLSPSSDFCILEIILRLRGYIVVLLGLLAVPLGLRRFILCLPVDPDRFTHYQHLAFQLTILGNQFLDIKCYFF